MRSLAIAAISLTLAAPALAASPPGPGNYYAESILTAVQGDCGSDRPGLVSSGILEYHGPSSGTATFRTIGPAGLVRTVFTTSGGLGTTNQTGTFSETVAGNPPVTGQFNATFGYVDSKSFTVTYDATNGFCSESAAVYLIRI